MASAAFAMLGLAAVLTTNALAANDCQQIKADIAKSGSYIYHYRDPSQPNLDLYKRFVNSTTQCAADAQAEYTNFPSIADCPVQHCAQMYGRNAS